MLSLGSLSLFWYLGKWSTNKAGEFGRKQSYKVKWCDIKTPIFLLVCVLCFQGQPSRKHAYNVEPLKPHFYLVKLGYTGVYIIFLISTQIIDLHNLCFEQKYEKISEFLSENFYFLVVKFSVYLNRLVFVMLTGVVYDCPSLFQYRYDWSKAILSLYRLLLSHSVICIL